MKVDKCRSGRRRWCARRSAAGREQQPLIKPADPDQHEPKPDERQRTIDALENIAAELERLRILKEHELGVVVEPEPDPYVRCVGVDEEQ